MKKYSKKKIGLAFCIVIALTLLVIPTTAFAKKNASSNASSSAADDACKNALYSGDMLSGSYSNGNYVVTINAKNGTWLIKYWYGDEDGDPEDDGNPGFDYSNAETTNPNGSFTYKGGSAQTITILRTNSAQKLVVMAELQGKTDEDPPKGFDKDGKILKVSYEYKENKKTKTATTTCRPGTVALNSKSKFAISGTGAVITKAITAKSTKEDQKDKIYNNSECQAMRDAKFNVGDNDSYLDATYIAGYTSQMTKSFPYCYGSSFNSSYELTSKTIKKVRQSSLNAYKAYAKYLESAANNDEYDKATEEINADLYNKDTNKSGYRELTYSASGMNLPETLSCTKDQLTERTEKFYTTHVEKSKEAGDACDVACREQLQVIYDPPVDVIAGLCFQYKVTVKSKVTCHVSEDIKVNWPTPQTSCGYAPICSGNEQETQAGPNEEFDGCMKSCDGGKYTQSCINSCYKKVYKNTNTNIKNTSSEVLETPKVERLAKSKNDPYYQDSKCDTNSDIKSHLDYCVDFFYKTKQKYPMGNYKTKPAGSPKWMDYVWKPCWDNTKSGCSITDDDDKKIEYTVDDTNWSSSEENMVEAIKRSSPYYFRNTKVAKKTIQSFYGKGNGVNGYGYARKYNIDSGGIKRQWSTSYQCEETCGFVKDDDNASDCKSSDKEIRTYYTEAFEDIKDKLNDCSTTAICKEDTATFDISADKKIINYSTNKEEQRNSKFNAQNTSGNTCISPSGDIEMFIPLTKDNTKGAIDYDTANSECNINPNGINGKCYGRTNLTYWQHYKTTITFPGSYFDLKSGKLTYNKNEVDEDTLDSREHEYCLPKNTKSVNEDWWMWKRGEPDCDGNKTTIEADLSTIEKITVEKTDNIVANINKFGKYNWSVKLNCFYAVSEKVCRKEECDDPCKCENSTNSCNAEFRPVTVQNLFPDDNGAGSRKAGFNWTSAAQDKTVTKQETGYGIDPGKYAEELQKTATTNSEVNYSGTADYEVILTKDNINELRAYAKKNGYTLFGATKDNPDTPKGTYVPVDGVENLFYYNSRIIHDPKYVSNAATIKNPSVQLGVNNN